MNRPGPLRVLILTPDFPPAPGGIQLLMGKLAEHLPRASVRVFTLARPGAPAREARAGLEIRRVRLGASVRRLRMGSLGVRALAGALYRRPDAVLVGHLAVFAPARIIRRLTGAPVVLYVHAEEFRVWPGRARRAVRAADAVIAVSRHTEAMALASGADTTRVHRILHGVQAPAAHRPDGRAGQPPTVLTVARIAQSHKGHDVMLEAIDRLRERLPDVRWVVIGDGPLRPELQRAAAARGLERSVSFLGNLPDPERDAWLERAHVFAMPSRVPEGGVGGEGFGLVFLEAAAHGLPVVAGAEGGALDAVDAGRSGLLVDPRDPQAVADALELILCDPALAAAMGGAARAWAEGFSWAATAEQVRTVLELAAHHPARARSSFASLGAEG